ncbi:MAG TPA: hypothetical protein VEU08_17835 [Vicinamibacterales bacterium]|nr:hypothetical protein [Vicinamibacterales bacterium]
MKTTNKRQYESLKSVLGLCEEHKEPIEAMPLGKPFMDALRQSVSKSGDALKSLSDGRNAGHQASAARHASATIVRQQAEDLIRTARVLGAPSGTAIDLPPMRNASHQQLIADARSVLEQVAPLAGVFKAHKIQSYDDLPKQIALLDGGVDATKAARTQRAGARAALKDALGAGADAAAGLQPLFFAVASGDLDAISQWKDARRIGPSRAGKSAAPAAPPEPAPAAPPVEKAS